MSDNEFEDLRIFGKTIDNKNNQKKVVFKKKLIIKKSKLDFKKFSLKILKIFILFLRKLKHGLLKIIIGLKTRYLEFNSKRQNHLKIFYKIIETKKQRGNKVIIVRKRVPYKYTPDKIFLKKSNLNSLYYLSINTNEDGSINNNNEIYTILRESVWDFKIKLKKKKKKR